MNISIFDVIGPIMVGPSSSHTAGAVKLAGTAAQIAEKPFTRVHFALHGSFAKTGKGHGTHLALLAGVLGIKKDDEAIKQSPAIANARGIAYSFSEIELLDVHENSVLFTFSHDDGSESKIIGCSIGGGRILVTSIDGVPVELAAEQPTLVIQQRDERGAISGISRVLAAHNNNIAVMRVTRRAKRGVATTVIESDEPITADIVKDLLALEAVLSVRVIQ